MLPFQSHRILRIRESYSGGREKEKRALFLFLWRTLCGRATLLKWKFHRASLGEEYAHTVNTAAGNKYCWIDFARWIYITDINRFTFKRLNWYIQFSRPRWLAGTIDNLPKLFVRFRWIVNVRIIHGLFAIIGNCIHHDRCHDRS